MRMVSPFVSATWLRHRLLDCLKNIRVVDGRWPQKTLGGGGGGGLNL